MKKISLLFLNLLSFFIFSYQTLSAQTGIIWTSSTCPANDWRSVTYGKGLFVAVAFDATGNVVMTSPDGITWTSRTSPANGWTSVTFGNGLFLAVSEGNGNSVMTSPDGINWTMRASPAGLWSAVTYGNGLFAAVGLSGVMTSPDGINWTTHTAPSEYWSSITYGNGMFVAVAEEYGNSDIMTSVNGITWTGQNGVTNTFWFAVTFGNSVFASVGGNGDISLENVMTSPNAVTWTAQNAPQKDNAWQGIAYGNNLFVAVGFNGKSNDIYVITSPDGINWTGRVAPSGIWSSITYGNGMFVAVSRYAGITMTSGTLGALAVNWLNINGTINSTNNVQLNWKVSEENVRNYAIEKSNDGVSYNAIATINSKGNGENSYTFTETTKLVADAWFHIIQTDNDGKINYSSTIFISGKNLDKVKVYPNPANETVTVNVIDARLNKTARLTNMDGKLLQTVRITSPSITLNLQGYSAGVYLLKVENETPIKISKQ